MATRSPQARTSGASPFDWWLVAGCVVAVLVLLVAMVATGPDDGRNER